MKYGMNLLLWSGEVTEEMLPVCEQLKGIGYDSVELPMFNLDLDYAKIGKRLDEIGLGRTAVTIRGEEDNPISCDPAVRAKGVELNKKTLDCCAAAGVEILVGPYHSAIGLFSGAGPTEDEWKWGVESMRATAEYAETVGVKLGVEALNRFECYLLNCHGDSARFAREVDHPSCGIMYDTFHSNIEEKSITEAIQAGGDKLFHIHISENDRSTPGKGGVNWKENFDAIVQSGYDGYLTIEAFGLALPEIAAATKIWRKMFSDELTLAKEGLEFMKAELAARNA
ncbi:MULTISPECIES: sugar phosphate isomerase/epimerase family protein [Rhodopirellula]|uniref:Xylose isomerase domain-containing protein n=2 Tax=Rhodopirellula TaxID=265488 RepID=M5SKZ4_9BACT|nr:MULTISPECIES: sugar phosphate isomerase/epimerase [Rhodopirellula]EMI28407.1 xylose isomerase domain-containing protein [Rhodopirellula europaea SH398]MCR9209296.1 sugar phosphate isomerase/epimerase [bacterium]PHQ35217.1 isomerase [Rhodopirellula bahusiensis]